MTKMTLSAKVRKFEYLEEEKLIVRKGKPMTYKPRLKVGNCSLCNLPVLVSPGQIINYKTDKFGEKTFSHKSCSKNR